MFRLDVECFIIGSFKMRARHDRLAELSLLPSSLTIRDWQEHCYASITLRPASGVVVLKHTPR